MLTPSRVRVPPLSTFPRAVLAALLAVACTEPRPTTVLEPLVRLTHRSATLRQDNVPERCSLGAEYRPAFGCPPRVFMAATIEPDAKGPKTIVLESTVPRSPAWIA